MTTAYVVEVQLKGGAQYMTSNGKLAPAPKFFLSQPAVRSYIQGLFRRPNYYNATLMSEFTRIIVIKELEKGLKDSKAEILFYGEFLASSEPKGASRIKAQKNAVYKLRTAAGEWVKVGALRPKFGKIWNRASDLRNHITLLMTHGYNQHAPVPLPHRYIGAEVIEIVMEDDGFRQKAVNIYPIVDFYAASPACRPRLKT